MNRNYRKLFALLMVFALILQYSVGAGVLTVYADGEENPVVEINEESPSDEAPAQSDPSNSAPQNMSAEPVSETKGEPEVAQLGNENPNDAGDIPEETAGTGSDANASTNANTNTQQADASADGATKLDNPKSEPLLAAKDAGGDSAGESESDNSYEVSGSKTADPTELGEDRKTTVTISLPSAEYKNEIDIVFVMDKSTSTTNNDIEFADQVTDLLSDILRQNVNLTINIGIVKFRGVAEDAIAKVTGNQKKQLTKYSDLTEEELQNAIRANPSGNGSNLHGGMDMADEWLSAHTDLEDSHKYVVVLTDGKSYIWNNEENEPTTFYAQYFRKKQIQASGRPQIGQSYNYDKVASPYDKNTVFWFDDYSDLHSNTNSILTGSSEYEQFCNYAVDGSQPTGNVVSHPVTNGSGSNNSYNKYYEYSADDKWNGLVYFEASPYEIIINDDGSYSYDKTKPNPKFYQSNPDSLQKGLYMAGHLWSDMNDKYNCGSIIFDGWKDATGLSVAKSFCGWMKENSDYSADINNVDSVSAMFNAINNDIIYLIGKGVVTDKIKDDFDLDESDSSKTFRIKVGDDIINLSSNSGSDWYFGEAVDGVYPYVVHYNADTKTITWDINVPVENARRAALSYGLILKEGSPEGYYDTNEFAELAYTSSDGKREGIFVFQKPKVHYAVKPEPTPAPEPTPEPEPEPTITPEKDSGTVVPAKAAAVSQGVKTSDDSHVIAYGITLFAALLMLTLCIAHRRKNHNS